MEWDLPLLVPNKDRADTTLARKLVRRNTIWGGSNLATSVTWQVKEEGGEGREGGEW